MFALGYIYIYDREITQNTAFPGLKYELMWSIKTFSMLKCLYMILVEHINSTKNIWYLYLLVCIRAIRKQTKTKYLNWQNACLQYTILINVFIGNIFFFK